MDKITEWVNMYGLIFIASIMIPNIIYAVKIKDGFKNLWHNKAVEVLEQIGRMGCFAFMILKGPYFGFHSNEAFGIYLIVGAILIVLYCIIWTICFNKNSIFKALSLSIIPSVLFLFCAIISNSVLLAIFAVIFAPCHILISYKNAAKAQ